MTINLLKKEGMKDSVSVDGIKLHSAYAPEKEAQRFVDSLECSFLPSYILITEPALSYCAQFLRERFPGAKLCCVRYNSFFSDYNYFWDKSFLYDSHSYVPLSQQLFNYMGEEGISACLFASWKPSEKAFPSECSAVWNEIKSAVLKSRAVLTTMTYFAKRWTRNSIRFCLFSHKNAYIQKGSSPVVVCASGPSLQTSFPKLIEHRHSFFLIALSSALKPLIENSLIPDLIVTTDGGYWAKQHLSFAMENDFDIPVAMPVEAACYGKIFDRTVIPLSYGDGSGEDILKECGYIQVKAMRNGTVSGTAAKLALDISDGNVYFCGLDLAPSKGFCHTQPNELELTGAAKDYRLSTKETRLSQGSFPSTALSAYRDWFKGSDFGGRLFRLSNNFVYSNSLGKISDVNWKYFESHNTRKLPKPNLVFTETDFSIEERKKKIRGIIESHMHDDEWVKNIFPSEYIVLERNKGTENEVSVRKKIMEKMNVFCREMTDYLDKGQGQREK
ncbi:MAG: DUF115 domain-containing protein [Treponema sp.]|nr:DUF115 domain-containing protein [Treponema sp.]MBQ5384437.1 DUF115 domain-containing protein [Treponema sp.]